mmetsp:Transcript_35852/g.58459  ORF Transcript_35852/g.58459 Transcript_35852/m.58459 type:complete len:250 (-) Transcript_35852:208-957(-)
MSTASSRLTPSQRLALTKYMESPTPERWLNLVKSLRRKRRRHRNAIDSVSESPTIMGVEDLAPSSDVTSYAETGKEKADTKKKPVFIHLQVTPPQQDVPQTENILPSKDASHRQAEMNDDEAEETALRTPGVVASEKDENLIRSIAIRSSSREGGNNGTTTGDNDVIIVPEALLVGVLIPTVFFFLVRTPMVLFLFALISIGVFLGMMSGEKHHNDTSKSMVASKNLCKAKDRECLPNTHSQTETCRSQ